MYFNVEHFYYSDNTLKYSPFFSVYLCWRVCCFFGTPNLSLIFLSVTLCNCCLMAFRLLFYFQLVPSDHYFDFYSVAGTISLSTLVCCCCCCSCCWCCDFWFDSKNDAATFGLRFLIVFLPASMKIEWRFGMRLQNWREIFYVHSDSFIVRSELCAQCQF